MEADHPAPPLEKQRILYEKYFYSDLKNSVLVPVRLPKIALQNKQNRVLNPAKIPKTNYIISYQLLVNDLR